MSNFLITGIFFSLCSLNLFASTVGLNLKNNHIVKILEITDNEVKYRESGYRQILTSRRTDMTLAIQELDGIKKFERVLFEVDGKLEISRVSFVFDNGLVMVSRQTVKDSEIQIENYLINQKNIINNVEELEGFKIGEKVCLSNRVGTYSRGSCGSINRIYENGYIELVMFDFKEIRANHEQFDLLVLLNQVDHQK